MAVVVNPFAFSSVGSLAYRSAAGSSGATITKPAGVAVGDIVLVMATFGVGGKTLSTSGGSAWNRTELAWVSSGYGYYSVLFWKILNATDVANAWNLNVAAYTMSAVAYSGTPANATVKAMTENNSGVGELVLAGFAPAANSLGVVTLIHDRDDDLVSITPPAGFAERLDATYGPFHVDVADKLSGYGGGDITWTDTYGDFTYPEAGFAVEIT